MPCSDGGPSYDDLQRQARDRDTVTRLACDRCKWLEKTGEVPEWAREWWESHKAEDRRRIQEDAQARREEQIRKRALSKLTKEEREELGL